MSPLGFALCFFFVCTFQYGESASVRASLPPSPFGISASLGGGATAGQSGATADATQALQRLQRETSQVIGGLSSLLFGIPSLGLEGLNAGLQKKQQLIGSLNNGLGSGVKSAVQFATDLVPVVVKVPLNLVGGGVGGLANVAGTGGAILDTLQKQVTNLSKTLAEATGSVNGLVGGLDSTLGGLASTAGGLTSTAGGLVSTAGQATAGLGVGGAVDGALGAAGGLATDPLASGSLSIGTPDLAVTT